MDISSIVTDEYLEARPDDELGAVRSTFNAESPSGILVIEGSDCVGVITPQALLRSQTSDDATVRTMMETAPRVEQTENVREVARLMVENGTRIAPVYVEGEGRGSIT